jgi:hypothetical protein
MQKRDSKYSNFNSDCPSITQNQSTLINDIRMGFQN